MNCSQCGAQVREHEKFCPQCGARIEDSLTMVDNAQEEQQEAKPITRPVAISRPREQEDYQQANDMGRAYYTDNHARYGGRAITSDKGYAWENRRGINGFAETLIALVANPISSGEDLYIRLSKKVSLIYIGVIILINACITYLNFSSLSVKIAETFHDIFDYFFGFGTIQYVLDKINVQVFLLAILSSILMVAYITALIMLLYKGLFKVDIEWIECVQLMMMPMVMSFFAKVIFWIVGMLSVKLALFIGGIALLLVIILTIIQFINRLGLSAMTVYLLPPIYIVCSLACMMLNYQFIKQYF